MNQYQRIVRHLEAFGSITSLEAMQEYGIMRLASRVSALKKSGLPVRTELVRGENRFGEPTCYARYSLDESEVVRDG